MTCWEKRKAEPRDAATRNAAALRRGRAFKAPRLQQSTGAENCGWGHRQLTHREIEVIASHLERSAKSQIRGQSSLQQNGADPFGKGMTNGIKDPPPRTAPADAEALAWRAGATKKDGTRQGKKGAGAIKEERQSRDGCEVTAGFSIQRPHAEWECRWVDRDDQQVAIATG